MEMLAILILIAFFCQITVSLVFKKDEIKHYKKLLFKIEENKEKTEVLENENIRSFIRKKS